MNYKYILILITIFLTSCEVQKPEIQYKDSFEFYSNKGFTLIYEDELYKKKIINKKIDERSLIVFNSKLKKDTPVKITNLLNGKDLIAKIGTNSQYPKFYNSVISERIAKELDLNLLEPYIQIQTILSSNSFLANKAKTFEEEKKVADKAPVDSITIQNIGITETSKVTKNINEFKNFRYIIKFADLYFEDSAIMLKERLFNEFNIKNVSIYKLSTNSFRVYIGPFKSLDSLKNGFNDINNLDFENIEILKL